MEKEETYIYGTHAVREALMVRPDVVLTLYIEEGKHQDLVRLAKEKGCRVESLIQKKLRGFDVTAVHQGVVALIHVDRLLISYEDFMRSYTVGEHSAFALLGEIQDPQNVGAIIRSAAAFGIGAVLLPEHRQAQITGAVIKVSVGTAFRVPLVQIGNVNHTILDLKERGFWVYGLEGSATEPLKKAQFDRPSVFVFGNEGEGIRAKTLEHCDITLSIPIASTVESLNAATSAAVVFYAWSTQHKPH